MNNNIKYRSGIINPFTNLFFLIFSIFTNIGVFAEENINNKKLIVEHNISQQELISPKRDFYILGPGDTISLSFKGLESEIENALKTTLNSKVKGFKINVDGNLFLPRLGKIYVEGLTIQELTDLLNIEYQKYVINPNLLIRIKNYRDVNVYVMGEVVRPGFYNLSDGKQNNQIIRPNLPTLFQAIKEANGITPYSKLDNIKVIRRLSRLNNYEKIQTEVNILSVLNQGDQSQNIRIYDDDYIIVGKNPTILKEQFLKAVVSNLNPEFISIYLSGRVRSNEVFDYKLPRATTLNQAISVGGGIKPISGKIEFFRSSTEGVEKRIFKYNKNAEINSYSNPILQAGDIIRVKGSIFSDIAEAVGEITKPAIGILVLDDIIGGD